MRYLKSVRLKTIFNKNHDFRGYYDIPQQVKCELKIERTNKKYTDYLYTKLN